ncbi:MAG: methionyl-tRNA formyltransferase [Clostridia bacterium]|nr:methionyl-tRNA formyltransferase [Clostridia bacterium]
MKIVFAGTPEFALAPLKAAIESGHEVVGVVTQEDKPQGRKGILTPSPVKAFALEAGLPVFQPKRIRDELEGLKALGGDVMITCAYGQILTQGVLDLFPKGVWNIHAGLLPAYRGASPIQSCILNGERETGVCLMQTELGLDTGDILRCEKLFIGREETSGELSARLSLLGASMLKEELSNIESGNFVLKKQGEDGARVVRKIGKETAKIDFSKSAVEIVNLVRAMNPEPVAYSAVGALKINVFKALEVDAGKYIEFTLGRDSAPTAGEILSEKPKQGLIVACGENEAVELCLVQAAGGKPMRGSDFLNGRKVKKGQVFSC